ncbi:MAG TPA: zf-TFIIB domain-containing protein, partial [Rubrivivax sp.]|nr:zf-TFIIB domain-containing protein [Rubrivivax sp.]
MAPDAKVLACSNCGAPLRTLSLPGHYGSTVQIDLCAPCHLVWFDVVESARLSGPGLLALIGEMAAAQALAHQPLRPGIGCP